MEPGRDWWELRPLMPKPAIPDCLVAVDGLVIKIVYKRTLVMSCFFFFPVKWVIDNYTNIDKKYFFTDIKYFLSDK